MIAGTIKGGRDGQKTERLENNDHKTYKSSFGRHRKEASGQETQVVSRTYKK